MRIQRGFALTGYLVIAGGVAAAIMAGGIWFLYAENESKAAALGAAEANRAVYEQAIAQNAQAAAELQAEAAFKDRIIADRDTKLRWAWHDYEKLKQSLDEVQTDDQDCQAWAVSPICPAVARFLRGDRPEGGDQGTGAAGEAPDDAPHGLP